MPWAGRPTRRGTAAAACGGERCLKTRQRGVVMLAQALAHVFGDVRGQRSVSRRGRSSRPSCARARRRARAGSRRWWRARRPATGPGPGAAVRPGARGLAQARQAGVARLQVAQAVHQVELVGPGAQALPEQARPSVLGRVRLHGGQLRVLIGHRLGKGACAALLICRAVVRGVAPSARRGRAGECSCSSVKLLTPTWRAKNRSSMLARGQG